MTTPQRRYPTTEEVIRIGDLVREHCHQVQERLPDRVAKYERGWDDEKIAKIIGHGLNPSSVATVRQAVVGKLPRIARNPANGAMARRIELVERSIADLDDVVRKVAALEKYAGDIEDVRRRLSTLEKSVREIKLDLARGWAALERATRPGQNGMSSRPLNGTRGSL